MSVTNQVLKRGSSGSSVKELQNLLNQNGANLDVDGNFGPKTLDAVKSYQQSNGLTVDGMVGNETMGALTGVGAKTTGSPTGVGASDSKAPTAPAGKTPAAPAGKAPAASEGFAYDDFSYDDYMESDTVSQAYAALQQQLAAKPGEYQSTWEGQINGLIDRILNREEFSYDVNEDALYQQLKDQYTALGKIASQDVMGQAAAMTGGYGNSYASSAGNQAYQAYLQQLNEAVPELYGMARDQHNQEGQEMYNQYGLLAEQESQDYGRWVDDYNQWASERDRLQGDYKDERSFDYGKYSDERNFAYGTYADDKNYAYNEYRNAIADQQWQNQFDESVRQYNEGMEYQQERDQISDTRYDESWAYQQERDKVSDARYDESFEYQKERDKVSDTQWSKNHVLNVKENNRAQEAWEMEKKAYEEAKTSGGSGNNQAALEHVSSMSSAEIVDTMKAYNYDEDNTGLAAFLDDCVASGRLTEEQADEYYKKYRTGSANDVYDTTVNPTYNGAGSNSGGRPGGIYSPNVAIK